MDNAALSPILVTGAHRSGTTWVGRTIAKAPGIAYIHEPLNLNARPGICDAPIEYWYTHISSSNENDFYFHIHNTLDFQYSLLAEIRAIGSARDAVRMIRDFVKLSYLRHVIRPRPLVKDPFAIFSAQWFEEVFNSSNIIIVRHPAGFVSSIMRKGWHFPFEHWLNQDSLMEEHLAPFATEIGNFAHAPRNILDQAILLWRAIHYVVNRYSEQHPTWIFLRYEDLCIDPIQRFASIFDQLDLGLTPAVERFIQRSTSSLNGTEAYNSSILNVRRNSGAMSRVWNERLSSGVINYIRKSTEEISCSFYGDTDWEIP
jgi:hypothetical protein